MCHLIQSVYNWCHELASKLHEITFACLYMVCNLYTVCAEHSAALNAAQTQGGWGNGNGYPSWYKYLWQEVLIFAVNLHSFS